VVLVVATVVGLPLVAKKYLRSDRDSLAAAASSRSDPCAAQSAATTEGACAPPRTDAPARPPPRFVDIGTTTCVPCKIMVKVMAELRQKYPATLEVKFVNIKHDEEALDRYGVSVIPTQIFYSHDGRELYRHTGALSTGEVVAKFKELGYDLGAPAGQR
jgi:thioredoxin 1